MRLSENDIRALVLIAVSEEPVNPGRLLEELGLRRETVSRLLTHLVEKGLVEREGPRLQSIPIRHQGKN